MVNIRPTGRLVGGAALAAGVAALLWFKANTGSGTGSPPSVSFVLLLAVSLGIAFAVSALGLPLWLERRGHGPRTVRFTRSLVPTSLVAGGFVVMSALSGGSFTTALVTDGWMLAFAVAFALIGAGVAQRRGESRHCPRCDYEFAFTDEALAPHRCPECGSPWLGLLVRGRRSRSPRLIGAGVAVLVLAFLVVMGPFAGPMGPSRHLPTPALVAWLGAAKYDEAGWAAIAGRTLTPAQTASLASRLLDRRRADRFALGVGATRWLDAQIVTASLPPELTERFFAEMFTGAIYAPRQVRRGRAFDVGLRDAWASDGLTYKCFVYIAGFGVGDEAPTAGRGPKGYYPILADRARHGAAKTPGAELVIAETGPATIKADLWIVVQPGFPAALSWTPDGRPILPSAAVWAKNVVLERTIDVAP